MSIPTSSATVNTNPRCEGAVPAAVSPAAGTAPSKTVPSAAPPHPTGTQSSTPFSPSDAVLRLPRAQRTADEAVIIGMATPYAGTEVFAALYALNAFVVTADRFFPAETTSHYIRETDTDNPFIPLMMTKVSSDLPSPSPPLPHIGEIGLSANLEDTA